MVLCKKKLWTYSKSQKKDHCGVAPLKVNDVVINDSLVKAQTPNEYFTSVFTPVTTETPPELHVRSAPDINPIIVDTNGVSELLQSLDIHKACGPDGIPAHLLKETREIISPSLAFISQASLQQCSLPLDWKRANIVLLFKKGDISLPSNYRPVSLTCVYLFKTVRTHCVFAYLLPLC